MKMKKFGLTEAKLFHRIFKNGGGGGGGEPGGGSSEPPLDPSLHAH